MRYYEISGGFRVPISEEEEELLDAAKEHDLLDESLDERSQEVARKMVSRGLLNRLSKAGKIYYEPNGLPLDIWRF